MLVIKGDENFKVSARHYFHDVASKIEGVKKRVESALDDDCNGAKLWVESSGGRRKMVKDDNGRPARSAKAISDEMSKALVDAVSLDSLFEGQLEKALKYEGRLDSGSDIKSYKAVSNRLESEVKALYFDCVQEIRGILKRVRDSLGDQLAMSLNVVREARLAQQLLVDVQSFDEFVDGSSTARSERVQDLLDDGFGYKLSEMVSKMSLQGPAFGEVVGIAKSTLEKVIDTITSDPDSEPDLRDAVETTIDNVGGELLETLTSECNRMFEPNDDLSRLVGEVVPKVVERTMLSQNRNYGVIRHLEDKIDEMFDGKNW